VPMLITPTPLSFGASWASRKKTGIIPVTTVSVEGDAEVALAILDSAVASAAVLKDTPKRTEPPGTLLAAALFLYAGDAPPDGESSRQGRQGMAPRRCTLFLWLRQMAKALGKEDEGWLRPRCRGSPAHPGRAKGSLDLGVVVISGARYRTSHNPLTTALLGTRHLYPEHAVVVEARGSPGASTTR
jgi:hypothetical protein